MVFLFDGLSFLSLFIQLQQLESMHLFSSRSVDTECPVVNAVCFLLFPVETMGSSDSRTAPRRHAEEGLLQQYPHRIPTDAIRNLDGRHQVEKVQVE